LISISYFIRNHNLIIGIVYTQDYVENKVFSPEKFKQVRIGRNRCNEVCFDGFTFSRIHTCFVYREYNWYVGDGIEDKKSTNGTWVYLDWKFRIENSVCVKIEKSLFRIKRMAEREFLI
jgi:hypothetical protein